MKMMKTQMDDESVKYIEPEMEVIVFENEDVITTSGKVETPDDPF